MKQLARRSVPVVIAALACGLTAWVAGNSWLESKISRGMMDGTVPRFAVDVESSIARVNQYFEKQWSDQQLQPADSAVDLQILRRLSLALFGTIPSLEEIRLFESERGPDRLQRWTVRMLLDERFNNYFSERLAVAFVGDRPNDYPAFRRERFQVWLSDGIRGGVGYDELVRQAITAAGPVTVECSTNFLTAEISQGDDYANRLAGRFTRAFLGQRIDCAECHDHPFAEWKQGDFQGLAAYFSQVHYSGSVTDDPGREHLVEDRKTLQKHVVQPSVPFHDDWLEQGGGRRNQLANWVTHSGNRRFRRAIANRVWGLMFGRPYVSPVDDLPDPPDGESADSDLLDLLGDDLAAHGYDLRRLALIITRSRPFLLASAHPGADSTHRYHTLTENWAVFPLIQLRTEQIGRSMQQLQSISTLRMDSDPLRHTYRTHWLREFAEQYGSLGELELDEQSSSVQQTIVRMTGRFTQQSIRPDLRHATTRIAQLTATDAECVEACFLVGLTRRATAAEQSHFVAQLSQAKNRERLRIVEDLFWSMLNSSEFAWNH